MEIIIAVVAVVVLGGVLLLAVASRRDANRAIGQLSRETKVRDIGTVSPEADDEEAESSRRAVENAAVVAYRGGGAVAVKETAAPAPWVPPDEEALGVTRRQFLNRSIIVAFILGISTFGAACIAFLYPKVGGGFGSKIRVGRIGDIEADIDAGAGFAYYPEGRMWITRFPSSGLEKARAVYSAPELAGMEAGVVALYQKCPHLGCRVPECVTSQWFECPCHGSQYNRVGEKKGGPAPRGMDRFAMEVTNGVLSVDTGTVINGPPIGVNTTGQEAEGPNCIGAADH